MEVRANLTWNCPPEGYRNEGSDEPSNCHSPAMIPPERLIANKGFERLYLHIVQIYYIVGSNCRIYRSVGEDSTRVKQLSISV